MARRKARTPNADCPDCDRTIYFEIVPNLGQRVVCPICETLLEVIHRDPLILDWSGDPHLDDPYAEEEQDLAFYYDDYRSFDYIDYGDEDDSEYGSQNGHDLTGAN